MKVIEVHSPLSALLADKSSYDAVWVSSLTHSAVNAFPDNELLVLRERAELVRQIKRVTDKPIIVDIDTGGSLNHINMNLGALRDAGAWAVVMEDKTGEKHNSLLGQATHKLADVDDFMVKIINSKFSIHNGLKVFARLESLIAERSVHEAVARAEAYIHAGADGIMVHSKEKVDAPSLMEVANKLRANHPDLTLIAVPTTYTLPDGHPFNIVIHANHLLRASMAAMQNFLNGKEVELTPVEEIFDLVGK